MDINSSRNMLSFLGGFPSLGFMGLYKEVPLGHMVLEAFRKQSLSEKVLSNRFTSHPCHHQ